MAGNLKQLRSILRQYKLISDSAIIPGEFQIIGIYCYVADTNFLRSLTPRLDSNRKEAIYLYDIVITDGTEKLKCVLGFPLGVLVQKFLIAIGNHIKISRVKMCYLEGEYSDGHILEYVLLEEITIIERAPVRFPSLDALTFVQSSNYRERTMTPLVTTRKTYFNLWVTVVPVGWTESDVPLYQDDGTVFNFVLLNDLQNDWRRLPRPYPPLLVKVLSRGKLHSFATNKNVDRAYPFLSFIEAADSTAIVTILSWNQLNQAIYYRATPGTILLVENYTLQDRCLRDYARHRGAAGILPMMTMEVFANEYSRVRIVPPDYGPLALTIATLPIVEFTFGNRRSLELAADKSTVDVVGLVTYVGHIQRFVYRHGRLYSRFWIEMIDGSCHYPFRILLYWSGDRYSYDDIHPGKVLVATHCMVRQLPDTLISDRENAVFLKVTFHSEVFIAHTQDSLYIRYPAVSAIATLIRDYPAEIDFLRNNVLRVGGFQTFPPAERTLELFLKTFGTSIYGNMIPGPFWNTKLEGLVFKERERLVLGGFIVSIEYIDLQTVDSPQPVYGWSYTTTIKSRRTIFLNIKARFKVGSLTPLYPDRNDKSPFPYQYTSDREELLQTYRQFPATEADHYNPVNEADLEDIPVLGDGFYIISIASLHYQALLQCVFLPEPTAKPHPTLMDVLHGRAEPLKPRNLGLFLSEPPRYTWDEVKKIQRTAAEVFDKTFVFSVDVCRSAPNMVQAQLQRAFICPPEQIDLAMAADRAGASASFSQL